MRKRPHLAPALNSHYPAALPSTMHQDAFGSGLTNQRVKCCCASVA